MSVTEINALHKKYLEVSDRFKAFWTYHQFVKSAYENLIDGSLPYAVDFKKVWEPIKQIQELLSSSKHDEVSVLLARSEKSLEEVAAHLLRADRDVSATVLRKFFERLARQDEQIIFNLVKFYIYVDRLEGDERDKLDYLLTRIGESHLTAGGEYAARESIALRHRLEALTRVFDENLFTNDGVVTTIRELREIKGAVDRARRLEDLTSGDLVGRLRKVKRESGPLFFHPDVMLAVIHANISMKEKFSSFYEVEEERIRESAERILSNEQAFRNDIASDPRIAEELARFRQLKAELDESRESSNVKLQHITRVKESLYRIVGEEPDHPGPRDEIREARGDEADDTETILLLFGTDEVYFPELRTILRTLAPWRDAPGEISAIARDVQTGLRLEPWEVEAILKVSRDPQRIDTPERHRDLLFLRGAALRMRINEQAKVMLDILNGTEDGDATLPLIRTTLAEAESADADFANMISDGSAKWPAHQIRWLHRSRIRLFRDFSGLWLIFDQHIAERSGGEAGSLR